MPVSSPTPPVLAPLSAPTNHPLPSPASSDAPLCLFCAVDRRFALPLAVTLHSALAHAQTVSRMHIMVADMGLRRRQRAKLRSIVERSAVDVRLDFCVPDVDALQGLSTTDWHRLPTYVRLLVDQLVPESWTRLLYLDGDVLVRSDLGPLWRTPIGDAVAVGVRDYREPTVWQRHELREAYTDHLGLPPDTPYCNAGVLLIDLPRWRAHEIGPRSLDFLRRYPERAYYNDQDALNAAIGGQWMLADPRWNVTLNSVAFYGFPEMHTPAMRAAQQQLLREARVVHYTGSHKPWHHLYRRPYSEPFMHSLRETRWFSPLRSWRWTTTRRVAHAVIQRVPDTVLMNAKSTVGTVRDRMKAVAS